MFICTNCWEKKCTCNTRSYVGIDDEMVDIICELNRKGYKTRNCCAGHLIKHKYSFLCTYIQFLSVISFDEIPDGFEYDMQELMDGCFVSDISRSIPIEYTKKGEFVGELNGEVLNAIQLETNKKVHLNILKEWVSRLPFLKEHE